MSRIIREGRTRRRRRRSAATILGQKAWATRFKVLMVAVLTLALSPFGSVLAYAGEGDAGTGAAGEIGGTAAVAQGGGMEAIADGNTASTWRDWGLENSTENVGRIWTDKTVQAGDITLPGIKEPIAKGDSTFLTALSAISSTSNLKSMATTPLDIVLVLDASGSMSNPMESDSGRTTRIDALKEAANSFVDEIAKQNEGVADASRQHQVAIVKLAGDESNRVGNDTYSDGQNTYNYSQVMRAMAACNNASKDQFKSTVKSIEPAGATRADNGLKLAKEQTSQREDAKKVVIFFTDGTPTSFREFDPRVASDAVSTAKSMKDAGASVYTIGIFSGADPSADVDGMRTSDENKFMQAASSNYPDAEYQRPLGPWEDDKYTWNFGTRAENADFYKSATNADELKKVFDDISKEIVQGAGYPTDTREGYEDESGFITFTDQLGDCMQVDGFTTIVFANQMFDNPVKTTNGLVDTYTFAGEAGNVLYPSGNMNSIDITVTHSEDLQTGDLVEVKIPGALIPLRHFEVNENGTSSVSLTFPIRVFYGSSLKADVAEELANPSSELAAYIASNSADGKVSFLANKWSGGKDGDVVANFTPSKGNSYYYITEDTPIYQNEACTESSRVDAPLEKGKTYYYQRTWYDIDNGKGEATKKTEAVPFNSGVVENINGYISSDADGKAYFKAGTPRMTYINELKTAKSENITETAGTFINPKWAGEQMNVLLGNNGKLSVAQPGTLAVTKELQLPDGYNAADFANEEFDFTVTVPDAANSVLKAEVKNAAGEVVASSFDLAFDANGEARQSLKSGEMLYVYGIADGAAYKVSETQRAGFTQAEQAGLEGTVSAGETTEAKVVNAYAATGMLNGATALAGEKVLTGRSWLSGDEFAFKLVNANSAVAAPMPDDGVVIKKASQPEGTSDGTPASFNFGNITYTQPGIYVYEIHESATDSKILPGVSTSNALYRITVTVEDENHDGTLAVTSEMKKLKDDKGEAVGEANSAVDKASFANVYDTSTVNWAPIGEKKYADSTGANPLKEDMFHVAVCTDDMDAPMPSGSEYRMVGGKTWCGAVTSVEASGGISFSQIPYGFVDLQGDTEKTYTYKLVEVVRVNDSWVAVKDALNNPDFNPAGMQYDATVWTARVTIKSVDNVLELSVSYTSDTANFESAGALQLSFINSYNPESATATIEGSKVLTGRDMAEGETFGFTLSAAGKATQDAIAAGSVALPASTTATVLGGKNGKAAGFSFGSVSFTKPGTYVFNVSETQWNGSALPEDGTGGLTFDRSAKTVTVVVTDDHSGSLKAEVSYPEGGVKFTNRYSSLATFAGIQVSKKLNGRAMKAGEFSFVIEGKDEDSTALLADADKRFTNEHDRADGVADVMTKLAGHAFTTADNDKTYEFEVREVIPEGAVFNEEAGLWYVAETGVYCDGAKHTVTISVSDDGNGAMSAVTKVDDVETNKVSFVNKYVPTPCELNIATELGLNKSIGGRPWKNGDSFTFDLTPITPDAPMPMKDGVKVTTATVTSDQEKDGRAPIDFGSIVYSKAGTYQYRVTEQRAGEHVGDLLYTNNVAEITVTVTDDGEGNLSASAKLATSPDTTKEFTNLYQEFAYNEVPIIVTKEITGTSDKYEGRFNFVLEALDDGPLPEGATPSGGKGAIATNGADGFVNFGKLIFDASIFEQTQTSDAGQATDNGQGAGDGQTAGDSQTSGDGDSNPALNPEGGNVAAGDATENGAGNKSGGGSSNADQLESDSGVSAQSDKLVGAVASGTADAVATDGAASSSTGGQDSATGNSTTDAATPDADPNTLTFEYIISEQPGDIANITYDQEKLHIEITAKSDAQGQITAEITRMWVEGGETPGPAEATVKGSSLHTFVNVFTPPYVPPVDPDPDPIFAAPTAKKILEGRALVAGEFSFELVENGKVVSTGINDANGNIVFSDIKHTVPGTHTYTMREVHAGTTEAGVTYDATTYTVTAKVTKSGGKLQVEYSVEGADGIVPAVFKNVYEPAGATVVIGATKTLAGKELSQGQFTFRLVGTDGTVVEATNDANGDIAFPELSFDKIGTYEFTMTEVKDDQANVTYDDASYRVVVTVTDDGKGQLVAEVSYPDGPPAFANSYTELTPEPGPGSDRDPTVTPTTDGPTVPGKSGPAKHFAKLAKTGDGVLLVAVPVAVGTVAAFAVGAMAFRLLRKRG